MTWSDRSDVAGSENALTLAFAARRAAGARTLDMTGSNPTRAALPAVDVGPLLASAAAGPYEPDPLGLADARAVIAAERGVDSDRVLMTASTSEAYALLFRLVADAGDEILVPEPSYPLLSHLAHATDVQLVGYALERDVGWTIDFGALHDAISPRARAIVAVSPNNPTGHYLDGDALDALTSFGLPVIVDEVFHPYALEGSGPRARSTDAVVFALDGLSKRAASPGLKLAWTVCFGPDAVIDEAMARLAVMSDAFLSASTPPQRALARILEATAPTRDAIVARCAANLAHLRAVSAGTALTIPRVEGGWYAPIRVPATRTDEAWALALLDDGVLVQPGYFYDFPLDEAWLVVSLLTPPDAFAEGVAKIVARAG